MRMPLSAGLLLALFTLGALFLVVRGLLLEGDQKKTRQPDRNMIKKLSHDQVNRMRKAQAVTATQWHNYIVSRPLGVVSD